MTSSKPKTLSIIGLVGAIIFCTALFQSISSTSDSIFVTLTIFIIVVLFAFSLWAAAFSFLGQIPLLNVIWVFVGLAALYILPILYWLN